MRTLKPLLAVLSAGYILMYYSELLFWARPRPADSLPGWLMTWLVYSCLAFAFLAVIARFHVSTRWGLFLAGAVFGWLAEGLVVQTAYENLPFSLSFTGLAWHALISVWVGWYAVRKAIATSTRATVILSAAVGVGYGLWAISWWLEPDGGRSAPQSFALYSLAAGLLLALAYWLYEATLPAHFSPGRGAQIAAALPFLLYFAFVTIPAAPSAALILPALLVLAYLGLRGRRPAQAPAAMLISLPGPHPARRYLGLLALPLAASLVYAAAFALDLRWHTNWLLYLLTTPAGFILFVLSMVYQWRRGAQ